MDINKPLRRRARRNRPRCQRCLTCVIHNNNYVCAQNQLSSPNGTDVAGFHNGPPAAWCRHFWQQNYEWTRRLPRCRRSFALFSCFSLIFAALELVTSHERDYLLFSSQVQVSLAYNLFDFPVEFLLYRQAQF